MPSQKLTQLQLTGSPSNGDLLYIVTDYESGSASLTGVSRSIYYSAFTNSNYIEGTYNQLNSYATGGSLSVGSYYLMTDYQTCYDQPNYDHNGSPITTGNYKTGSTEPLLLFAVSTTGFSSNVFSTLYPSDKISYDITWTTTEVTSSPAKGRITERIDNENNRTGYDSRAVQFIRYHGFYSENLFAGTVSLELGELGIGIITGVGTEFTNLTVGDIIGLYDTTAFMSCFRYYEISQISSDTEMEVAGKTVEPISDTYYALGINTIINPSSPIQCNVSGGIYDDFTEYYTFTQIGEVAANNYIGDSEVYDTFILSNNVFLEDNTHIDNTLGVNARSNTFVQYTENNTFGMGCQFNIIYNDINNNVIQYGFVKNIIAGDFYTNIIGNTFENNMIGNFDDEYEFSDNSIKTGFRLNYLTLTDNFQNNNIGTSFENNIIECWFENNNINGDFNSNLLKSNQDGAGVIQMTNNALGNTFQNNKIYYHFTKNQIGTSFEGNTIYNNFDINIVGHVSSNNTFGDPDDVGGTVFRDNTIGSSFSSNYFSGDTLSNVIGNGCTNNNINTSFSYNKIGNDFASNTIAQNFGTPFGDILGNVVGNNFTNNVIAEDCGGNIFGGSCQYNTLSYNFLNNTISYGFNNSTVNNVNDGSLGQFDSNNINIPYYSADLTLDSGVGGNPVFYKSTPATITRDFAENIFVTFLSGGTIVAQSTTV
jgi:hypothetical protein